MDEFKLSNEPIIRLDEDSYYCKFHHYNRRSDFILVTIKSTKEEVIRCVYCEDQREEGSKERSAEWAKEKEAITPYYVRRSLATGRRIRMVDIPDDLVEMKTAVIKLKRLTDQLNAPLKVCSKHGDLYEGSVIKAGKERSGAQKYRCKICMSSIHARNYQLNRAKINLRATQYRKEHREKVNAQKRKSAGLFKLKHLPLHIIERAAMRHHVEKSRKHEAAVRDAQELTDSYVKRKITNRSGLKSADIPCDLVQAKRAILMLKRGLKRKRDQYMYNYLQENEENVKK